MMVTVTEQWSDERIEDLWSAVFGSGGDSMPWWFVVDFLDGADWNIPGRVRLVMDYEGDRWSRTIDVSDFMEAFTLAVERGYRDACTGRRIHEHMDWDACSSDVILQLLVTDGQVIFS